MSKTFKNKNNNNNNFNSQNIIHQVEHNYDELPFDIWQIIANKIESKDIIRLSRVSRTLYIYMIDDVIIKPHLVNLLNEMATSIFKATHLSDRIKKIFDEESQNLLLSQDTIHEDILSDMYLFKLKNNFRKESFSNCYSLIVNWNYNLFPILFCLDLPDSNQIQINFLDMITRLYYCDFSKFTNIKRNCAWFTKSDWIGGQWLIKSTFKTPNFGNDDKKLVLSIKFANVNFCSYKTKFCVQERNNPITVETNKKNYYLRSGNSTCTLPKNNLTFRMFDKHANTGTAITKYFTLRMNCDISELKEIKEWALLYEFITKFTYYKKDNCNVIPKFYYGDFKNIKKDSVRKLFDGLNNLSRQFVKILENFKNYGKHEKGGYRCYCKYSDDEDNDDGYSSNERGCFRCITGDYYLMCSCETRY